MHIPDGYLSPATCAVTYAAALPFWIVAMRRLRDRLHTRTTPLLAAVAAFSFVIMMFNLPLPGGTTGHAVGMAVAAILLGPWAAMLAISIALFIQALFFGDGGLTTFGANCLNMAIVGSLVAHFVYRVAAAGATLDARRRVFAAALAGYVSINVAALFAAVEFGVQPLWFHADDGTPLYAPYPLAIAVPAMMIGHLGIAGIAEAVIAGGLVAYLQKSDPALLAATAGNARYGWLSTRRLWALLGVFMIASPLGLIAAGTAWGEWGADDFADAAVRSEIALASGNVQPPPAVPNGLARLASLWSAPIPDYAPPFLHSAAFGYIASALIGCGLVILASLLLARLPKRPGGLS
jgi:cobalt/nickel transport system permease protein